MEKNQAKNLIKQTFNQRFDKDIFREFIINLLDGINEQKAFFVGNAQVKEAFQKYISSYKRVGQYTDKNSNVWQNEYTKSAIEFTMTQRF